MRVKALWVAAFLAVFALTACSIHESGSKENKDVKIETPFGGMNVKTNPTAIAAEIGISVYPGAVPKKDDGDSSSANVDMHFGDFRLRVKAAGYRSEDSLEKVKAFYLKDLTKFGDVLECKNNAPLGKLNKTSEGLTCEESDNNKKVHVDGMDKSDTLQLKTGSKLHQHIVALQKEPSGTKIGLVALDLPAGTGKESN